MAGGARPAFPSCCTRCARCPRPPRTGPSRLAELVCSNSFRSDDASTNAVGVLHREMRALGSLVMQRRRRPPGAGRRRARRRPRRIFAGRRSGGSAAHPLITLERGEIAGLPPADWDSVIVATGPLTSPGARRGDRRASPAKARSPSSTPSRRSCTATRSTSTSPGCSRATTRQGPAATAPSYINCPLTPRAVRGLRRRAARRREDRVPRVRGHALFRRLPADRGDGRARPRNPAPRTDEAVRPDQPACSRRSSPTPSCSCGRTTRSARCSTSSASRPS